MSEVRQDKHSSPNSVFGVFEFIDFLKQAFPALDTPEFDGDPEKAMRFLSTLCVEKGIRVGLCSEHRLIYDAEKEPGCPECLAGGETLEDLWNINEFKLS